MGRILSWANDNLRIWDRDGKPLAVLKRRSDSVKGAIELSDGRILSWANDKLQIWDRDGKPLAVLKGQSGYVWRVIELSDGRIMSLVRYTTMHISERPGKLRDDLRIWDRDGKPLETHGINEALRLYPIARKLFYGKSCVYGDVLLEAKEYCAFLDPPCRIQPFCGKARQSVSPVAYVPTEHPSSPKPTAKSASSNSTMATAASRSINCVALTGKGSERTKRARGQDRRQAEKTVVEILGR